MIEILEKEINKSLQEIYEMIRTVQGCEVEIQLVSIKLGKTLIPIQEEAAK